MGRRGLRMRDEDFATGDAGWAWTEVKDAMGVSIRN